MLKLANIIVNMERERVELEDKVSKLERDLTKSENIRRDLVEVNKILTIAVQAAINDINEGQFVPLDLLVKAENEVKKISIREY